MIKIFRNQVKVIVKAYDRNIQHGL